MNAAAPSMRLLAASQRSLLVFSLAPGTIDRKKKRREGRMCAVDHADFSLRAFLPASPHLFYPLPFDVPGPSSLIQRASQTAQPGLAPAGSPSLCHLGCAEPRRPSGPAPPSLTPQRPDRWLRAAPLQSPFALFRRGWKIEVKHFPH